MSHDALAGVFFTSHDARPSQCKFLMAYCKRSVSSSSIQHSWLNIILYICVIAPIRGNNETALRVSQYRFSFVIQLLTDRFTTEDQAIPQSLTESFENQGGLTTKHHKASSARAQPPRPLTLLCLSTPSHMNATCSRIFLDQKPRECASTSCSPKIHTHPQIICNLQRSLKIDLDALQHYVHSFRTPLFHNGLFLLKII